MEKLKPQEKWYWVQVSRRSPQQYINFFASTHQDLPHGIHEYLVPGSFWESLLPEEKENDYGYFAYGQQGHYYCMRLKKEDIRRAADEDIEKYQKCRDVRS